ncbi:hypothetical protein DXG01_007073 [Tephrocybe rancida]|nr:hypothetical protein DXG01_007073 [Tephrocybe rancida]
MNAVGFATLAAGSAAGSQSISALNPFLGHEFFISPVYRPKVLQAAANLTMRGEFALAKKAVKVATSVSTFLWVSDFATIPDIAGWLRSAQATQIISRKKQVVQIEVPAFQYMRPHRICINTDARSTIYPTGTAVPKLAREKSSWRRETSIASFLIPGTGEEKYKTFIQQVKQELQKFPDVRVVLQLETDSIGNLVSNLGMCKHLSMSARSLAYAIATLQLPNVALYLDGAHAGWLGWDSILHPQSSLLLKNIGPTAVLMGELLTAARVINPKAIIRGVATDVSNYNGLGNQPEQGYDELVYIRNLAPLLAAQGIDAHFIVDQGRSGNQAYTRVGTDWCNNKYAGFGTRPTTATPDPLIDAIVWAKPGGEADGTSDTSAARYDEACGSDASLKPAPEAGTWFQQYFEQLLKNANPPI